MNLIIFLTHNFSKEFVNTLEKIDNDVVLIKYKTIVLFDKARDYDDSFNHKFKNIEIIKINHIKSSYDNLSGGHTMYINYFKNNYEQIKMYEHVWIIENDVYYPNSFMKFISIHDQYNYDLLVPEYSVRGMGWGWTSTLKGFKNVQRIGVAAFIMRVSQKLLLKIIDTIDNTYFGFLEALLPHICMDNNLSIQQFLPEMCGILMTCGSATLDLIKKDVQENTKKYIENKIYHPIKL
jgi:hypothetical protein